MKLGFAFSAVAVAVLLLACGGPDKPPKRGVLEQDLDDWKFRRYQAVLDIEVWVPENQAAAHTASYVRNQAEKSGRLEEGDVVNVFVTRYEADAGIARALIKFSRRLAQEQGYVVDEDRVKGVQVISVKGHGESWAVWAAKKHVVKVGGRGLDKLPGSLIEEYGDRYPSRLKAGMIEGELPEGPDEPEPEKEEYDPSNPSPDWDRDTAKKKSGKKKGKK